MATSVLRETWDGNDEVLAMVVPVAEVRKAQDFRALKFHLPLYL